MKTRFQPDELLAAIDSQDPDRFLGFLTPDARFRFGSIPAVEGASAIRGFLVPFFDGLESIQHRKSGFWEVAGDQAFLEGEVTYHYSNGREATVPFLNHFHLKDGRVHEYDIYVDPTPAIEAMNGARS